MADGRRRQVAPVRKLVAAVLGTFATFVILFGFGLGSWAVVVLGVALLAVSIGLVAITAVRSGPRAWVTGVGHVHSVTEPPASSAFGRCELQIVIDAPGVPARSVKIRDPRVPVSKWPDPGATLPIMVAIDDQRHVRILWDEVLTHAEAAGSGDLPPAFDGLDPLGDDILIEQEAPPWARGGPDDAYSARPDDAYSARPAGPGTEDLAADLAALRGELDEARDDRGGPRDDRGGPRDEPVVMRQTPGGTIVLEGTLVDPPATGLPRRSRPGPGPGGRTRRPSPTPKAAAGAPPAPTAPDVPAPEAAATGATVSGVPVQDTPPPDIPVAAEPAPDEPAAQRPGQPHVPPAQRSGQRTEPSIPEARPAVPETRTGDFPKARTGDFPKARTGDFPGPGAGPAHDPTVEVQAARIPAAGTTPSEPDPPVPAPESGSTATSPFLDDIDIPLDDPGPDRRRPEPPRASVDPDPEHRRPEPPDPIDDPPVSPDDEAILTGLIDTPPPARLGGSGPISGVGITLLVADLDRSIAFYRDLLGFFEIDGGEGNAILASGATRLVLRAIRDVAPINRRLVHLNLEVNDVHAVYEELLAKDIKFTYAPRAVNRGAKLELWAAAFRDPDGHGIALTQWRGRPTA